MGWYWNPLGILGIVNGSMSLLLATIVFVTGPHRPQNRSLSLVLFLESSGGLCGAGLLYMTDHPPTGFGFQAVAYAASVPIAMAYLNFLGTLPSPLTGAFRQNATRWALLVIAAASMIFFLARIDLFLAGVAPTPYARLEALHGPLLFPVMVVPGILVVLFGGLVALSMWWSAPPRTLRRRQGFSYLVAFGWRDATWLTMFILFFWLEVLTPVTVWGISIALGVFPFLLAYAVLRHQILDIDLKIKWTINRGTLVGVFLAVFFVTGVIAENWLTDRFGLAFGGVAAGLLLFALNPLQRFADRVSDAAMPDVEDSESYLARRREEIFRAQVEELLADGTFTAKERSALLRLQSDLGIDGNLANRIEADVLTGWRGGAL